MLKPNDKIILTGANGFIGYYLKNNYAITVLDYNQESFEDNYISLDLTDEAEVTTFVENAPTCDVLIILVGLAHKQAIISLTERKLRLALIYKVDRRKKESTQ